MKSGDPAADGCSPAAVPVGDVSDGGESEDVLPDARFLDFFEDGETVSLAPRLCASRSPVKGGQLCSFAQFKSDVLSIDL
jgi:hypothetical protein